MCGTASLGECENFWVIVMLILLSSYVEVQYIVVETAYQNGFEIRFLLRPNDSIADSMCHIVFPKITKQGFDNLIDSSI